MFGAYADGKRNVHIVHSMEAAYAIATKPIHR